MGLTLIFFGGTFLTTLAAVEAFRQTAYPTVKVRTMLMLLVVLRLVPVLVLLLVLLPVLLRLPVLTSLFQRCTTT